MMRVAGRPLINPVWVFLFTGEIPGKWAFIGGSLVLAAVTERGIVTAIQGPAVGGTIPVPPAAPTQPVL